jgi:hypothetical protein
MRRLTQKTDSRRAFGTGRPPAFGAAWRASDAPPRSPPPSEDDEDDPDAPVPLDEPPPPIPVPQPPGPAPLQLGEP